MALSSIVNLGTHVEAPLVTFEGHLCTILIPFSKIGLKNTCEPMLLHQSFAPGEPRVLFTMPP